MRLKRSDCTDPGIARRRRGRGFQYLDPTGMMVEDRETLDRISALAIPPAWREVWICADPRGHLQATGLDAAGRKQYLYHERWRAHRDRRKFEAMVEFGRALPALRRRVGRDIQAERLSRVQILACAARLLDLGFFRIGSEQYAEQNDSYGLATVLRKHVDIHDSKLVFDYPAKSGQRRVQTIADQATIEIFKALLRRRGGGPEVLAYRQGRRWFDVRSEDINDYLKQAARGDFTAKDFRTWNATVLAAVELAVKGEPRSPTARKRAVADALKAVAACLGNTPAVCRAAYVDPRVIDLFISGTTIAPALSRLPHPASGSPALSKPRIRRRIEDAVLELLDG